MKILVIAPHPDDEVLGVGGTISNHVQKGDDVYLCIATKAYTPDWSEEFIEGRLKEIKASNKILGIKKTYFLDFPTVKLDAIPQKELNDTISGVVNDVKPDTAYIPFEGDVNKDHRLVFQAAMVAMRPFNCKVKKLLAYETLSGTECGFRLFKPNVFVNITDSLTKKIDAMSAYKSELKEYPHPRSIKSIEALAIKRGSEAGMNAAEAFILIWEKVQ